MQLNISLYKKIESILELSSDFDNLFNEIIKIKEPAVVKFREVLTERNLMESKETEFRKDSNEQSSSILNEESIIKIYNLTRIFILIRAEHGSLLILSDRNKEDIKSSSTELSDNLINKLYDLSTFYSIIDNISNLVSNIDFQFKKVAVMFPKYINKNPLSIVLVVDKIDKSNKYIQIIEMVKNSNPENIYKIIEYSTPDVLHRDSGGVNRTNSGGIRKNEVSEKFPKSESSLKKIKLGKLFNVDISIKIDKTPSLYLINHDKISEIPIELVNDHESFIKLIN